MKIENLVRTFGFPTLLTFGDTLVYDRWRWITRRLPKTRNGESVLDVGCGTGAFTIGAALRGYVSHGMSWDEDNHAKAVERAELCAADTASFEIGDARKLDTFDGFKDAYDAVLCLEVAEHILDDRKLFQDIAACLKPGGRLLFTTPNYLYRAISPEGRGPWSPVENGYHVRRGCTESMLKELADSAGLACEEIGQCSGFWSQKATWLWRQLQALGPSVAYAVALPIRPIAVLLDTVTLSHLWWPGFSITLVAQKPRFAGTDDATAQNNS
ncbi:MAG: class I SAM-dependent methyltransferase [Pseudomonadota bacterium]|nr:class I SAM-dependent methyltransferase [Pseudomonadota bacterium]